MGGYGYGYGYECRYGYRLGAECGGGGEGCDSRCSKARATVARIKGRVRTRGRVRCFAGRVRGRVS